MSHLLICSSDAHHRELNPGVPVGWQGSNYLSYLLLPGFQIGSKLEWRAEVRLELRYHDIPFHHEMGTSKQYQVAHVNSQCSTHLIKILNPTSCAGDTKQSRKKNTLNVLGGYVEFEAIDESLTMS